MSGFTESAFLFGVNCLTQIKLNVLAATWNFLNKGQGTNLGLSAHILGIGGLRLYEDLNQCPSMSNHKYLDALDCSATPIPFIGLNKRYEWNIFVPLKTDIFFIQIQVTDWIANESLSTHKPTFFEYQ